MNKNEIMEVLSEKSFPNKCVYCGEDIRAGFYVEDNIGRRLIFPKCLTKDFIKEEKEVPIHYRCVSPFIFDMLREGDGKIDGKPENTRVLIRC